MMKTCGFAIQQLRTEFTTQQAQTLDLNIKIKKKEFKTPYNYKHNDNYQESQNQNPMDKYYSSFFNTNMETNSLGMFSNQLNEV